MTILVIGNRLLGDSIDSLPALLSLQKKCGKDSQVVFHLLTYRYTQKLYQIFPFEKTFLIDEKEDFLSNKNFSWFKLFSKLKTFWGLRSEKYQGVFILPGGIGFGFLSYWLSPQWSVGHRNGRAWLLTHSIASSKLIPNHENFSRLVNLVPIAHDEEKSKMKNAKFMEEVKSTFVKFTQAFDLSKKGLNKKYLVLSATASEESKVWPQEYFRQLAEELSKQYLIVWVGVEKEREAIDTIRSGGQSKIGINLAGELSLSEVFYLIYKSSAFIGNDSGLAHGAAMLGVKTFILFGPTNITLSTPYDTSPKQNRIFSIYEDFKIPHDQRKHKKYAKQLAMRNLSYEKVITTVKTEMVPR